ncbi:MAG: DUF2490 domain-containing protein [Cyclobacteriaceae bacterium]
MKLKVLLLGFMLLAGTFSWAQTEKEITYHQHFWISTNNLYQLTRHWSVLTDFHIRRMDFLNNANFYFIRGGVQYSIKRNLRVAGGYAHMWLTSSSANQWERYTNENRIYQQVSFSHRYPGINTLFRIRNEQRIFNTHINCESLNDHYLINRVRMLLSASIPFSKNSRAQWLIADEIHVNFGKRVVYNTFNQNRLTLGIKYRLTKQWSFDTGYMMVFQQRNSGFQYDLNHTFRLFFYGTFDFRKDKSTQLDYVRHAEE